MKRRRTWIVVALLLLLLAVIAVGRLRSSTRAQVKPPVDEAVPVEVASVKRGTVERTVRVTGSITSARVAEVFASRAGRVARVLATDGARVSQGQAIVVLDTAEAAARVGQADAAARAADAQVALLQAGTRPEQIAQAAETVRQARAQVAAAAARLAALERGAREQERMVAAEVVRQAQSALAGAQTQVSHARVTVQTMEANLRRIEALLQEGAVSQAQVDQARWEADRARTQLAAAEAQVRAAQAQLASALQQQSLVEAGPRAEEIQIARAQLQQTRAGLAQAEQQHAMALRGPRAEEIRAVEAQRDQARAFLAEARQALAEMTIRAPFAGRLARLRVSAGDFVSSGEFGNTPIAVVYDDEQLEAEVTVGEREAGLLRPGQPAILSPEIVRGLTVRGVVKTVTPLADPGSRAVTVRLRVLDDPGEELLPGTFIRGTVVVERRVGVLTVPRAALRDGTTPVIWVVSAGVVDVRHIGVGLPEGDRIEVSSGVREGEQVVVLGPERLDDGAKVMIVNQGAR